MKSYTSWVYGDVMENVITFGEYLANLQELAEAYPEVKDFAVVQYTGDDLYEDVVNFPQVGRWDPIRLDFKRGTNKANSVCI